jgi:drug/metabolite transporter (DMT)-like permease
MPIWEVRLAGSLLLLALARPIGQSIKPPDRQSWLWIVGVALVDTLAFIAYTLGIHLSGQTGTVAVLSSLFSAVTILLARLFLKEKLEWSQWGGIGLILVGVGLVSLV